MATTAIGWTGWLEVDLGIATLDVAMRVDVVELWIGSRAVAVVDRDTLRTWADDPSPPLLMDDVAFVLLDAQPALRIDGSRPLPLPGGLVSHLFREL